MKQPPLFSLCRGEVPLHEAGLLDHVVDLLGNGADILLATDDQLLHGYQQTGCDIWFLCNTKEEGFLVLLISIDCQH